MTKYGNYIYNPSTPLPLGSDQNNISSETPDPIVKGYKKGQYIPGYLDSTRSENNFKVSVVPFSLSEDYGDSRDQKEKHGLIAENDYTGKNPTIKGGLTFYLDKNGNKVYFKKGDKFSLEQVVEMRNGREKSTIQELRNGLPNFDDLPEGMKLAAFDIHGNVNILPYKKLKEGFKAWLDGDRSNDNLLYILQNVSNNPEEQTKYNGVGRNNFDRMKGIVSNKLTNDGVGKTTIATNKLNENKKLRKEIDDVFYETLEEYPILKQFGDEK